MSFTLQLVITPRPTKEASPKMLQDANSAASDANLASHLSTLLFFNCLLSKSRPTRENTSNCLVNLSSTNLISAVVGHTSAGPIFIDQLPLLVKYNLTATSQILLFKE